MISRGTRCRCGDRSSLVDRRVGVLRESSARSGWTTAPISGCPGRARQSCTSARCGAGPCTAVRRVVDEVCGDLPAVAHVEIDMDANPAVARRLSVLSLPTTFIFDADGRQRYRTAGVPKAADLRSTLVPLLA